MSKKYCMNCGTGNIPMEGVAPRFCAKCGKSLTFVPSEKSASQAQTLKVNPNESSDINDLVDKLVMKKLNVLLRNGGFQKTADDDENEIVIASDHIPTPSSNDVVVQTPKFMTVADIKKLDHPITRSERPKFQDYSKE